MKKVFKNKYKMNIEGSGNYIHVGSENMRRSFCAYTFRRMFGINRKDYPLNKSREVEVTIKFLD